MKIAGITKIRVCYFQTAIIMVLPALMAACNGTDRAIPGPVTTVTIHADSTEGSRSSKIPDTMIVTEKTIVFVEPDSLRKAARISQMGKGTVDGEASYFQQYMAHAENFAERAAIPISVGTNADVFLFPASDSVYLTRDSLSSPWSLLLYEPGSKPKAILPSDIRSEAAGYFNQRH